MLPRLPSPSLTLHPTSEKGEVSGPNFQTLSKHVNKPARFVSCFPVPKEEVKLLLFKANPSACGPNPKIDQEGNPTGFAGLVSHLHYHEPSNFVFVSFLVRGIFHNLCQPTRKGKLDVSYVWSKNSTDAIVKLTLQEIFFFYKGNAS